MVVCTRCKIAKEESAFYWNNQKDRPKEWCKACYSDWHRQRYTPKHGTDDSPRDCAWCGESFRPKTRRFAKFCSRECLAAERVGSGRARERHLLRTYGITSADYERMFAEQDGGCAICGLRPEDQTRYQKFLHVDHCHTTGRVRGLLCDQHNLLLGRFDHDPALLRRAADYLEASMREQIQNERDNAEAYGDTARVEKLDRELSALDAPAMKRAAAVGGDRKSRPTVRTKADQTREEGSPA